jgi:hypothetical protein
MLKEKFGLTTDRGMDYQSVLFMAMGAITQMEPGHEKSILLGLCLLCMSAVAYLTRGSAASKPSIDPSEPIEDVVEDGRK